MISSTEIDQNLSRIQTKIKIAAEKVDKNIQDIHFLAVTKTLPIQSWNFAVDRGLTIIGESRIQEAEKKLHQFKQKQKIELHFIGHLQQNKTRKAIKYFDVIQTVDTVKLLERINKISKEKNKLQRIFFQVNIERNTNKNRFGFTEKEVFNAAKISKELKNISLEGIMTTPSLNLTEKQIKELYKQTRAIKNKIQETINEKCKYLSMGMSNDYVLAINEGSTHIRIGSALFGKR